MCGTWYQSPTALWYSCAVSPVSYRTLFSRSTADDSHLIWFDCNQNFSLQSVVLPWNFKLFFISGTTLSSFSPILKKAACVFPLPLPLRWSAASSLFLTFRKLRRQKNFFWCTRIWLPFLQASAWSAVLPEKQRNRHRPGISQKSMTFWIIITGRNFPWSILKIPWAWAVTACAGTFLLFTGSRPFAT